MSNEKKVEELRSHVKDLDNQIQVLEDAREFTLSRIDVLEKDVDSDPIKSIQGCYNRG